MQPGFDRPHGHARKILNFLELVAFRIVQKDDDPVVLAKLLQRRIEPFQLLDTLAVGDTVTLEATVLDSLGNPIVATILWATLNPGLATVDASGLVTAVAAGDVQIAATYAGVGDVADIHVTAAAPVPAFRDASGFEGELENTER